PWRQYWHPNRGEPSTRVTWVPARTSSAAAARPAGPAPMTTAPMGAVPAVIGSAMSSIPRSGRRLPRHVRGRPGPHLPPVSHLHPVRPLHQTVPLIRPAVDGGQAVVTDAYAAEEASGRAGAASAAPGHAFLIEQEGGGDRARHRDAERSTVDGDGHRPAGRG